jgi:uncharacterized protein YoaH (UPF0181 family)
MAGTINACFQKAVAAGKLSAKTAQERSARIDELMQKGISEADAIAKAAQEVKDSAARQARQAAIRVTKAAEVEALTATHPAGRAAGVQALLARDLRGQVNYSNVERRARAVRGLAHAPLTDVLDRFRAKFLGLKMDKEGLQDFIGALYGGAKSPEFAGYAKAWSETVERLRQRFEAAGGHIPALATWRFPQVWGRDAVAKAGRGAFTAFMQDAHARGALRINDLDTGQALTGVRADAIIRDAYDRITTGGLSDLEPGKQVGASSLANSRTSPRAFEWTTEDAWIDANRRFGQGDAGIFDLLNGHIDSISRDIGMMEVLGPNPDWTIRYLTDLARKEAGAAKAEGASAAIERTWDHVSGRASSPVSEFWANFMDQTRAFLTSAQLGSAMLSSVSDLWTMRLASAFNGMSAAGAMGRYLAQMNPANAADRAAAVRAGLIAEHWAQRASGGLRFLADTQGVGLGTRAADLVMRLSLLSPHTQAAKNAIGLEFLGTLADRAGQAFGKLDQPLRDALTRYDITPAQWDLIRTRGLQQGAGGAQMISADDLARTGADGTEAATRLLEMVQAETRFAIPEPGAAERALTLRGTRRGTFEGEFMRSIMQYKSFPITMMTTHLMRSLNQARQGDYGRYFASLVVGLTAMGALSIQLRQIAQGKDPRDMNDYRFLGAAFAQGGGSGLIGDFLYTSVSRTDGSFAMNTIGGPIGGLMDDLAKIAGLNIAAAAEDKDRAFGADLARFVRRNTPGTSLWYTRLAVDRLVWDALQDQVDPKAQQRWRQLERRAYRDYQQEYWWRPGQAAASRAPEPAAMGGPTR